MIGTVDLQSHDERATATLGEDLTWSYEGSARLARSLEATARALDFDDPGPSGGNYGIALLNLLASRVGGTAHIEHKVPAPPGTVY